MFRFWTYTQYIAMVALSEQDDQTVGELGEKMFLESNTLTPILKKLESLGFLVRRRDPADERQVRVSLTPAGRSLLGTISTAQLLEATGLGEDFPAVQKTVSRLARQPSARRAGPAGVTMRGGLPATATKML